MALGACIESPARYSSGESRRVAKRARSCRNAQPPIPVVRFCLLFVDDWLFRALLNLFHQREITGLPGIVEPGRKRTVETHHDVVALGGHGLPSGSAPPGSRGCRD